jgi:hypothetical protein
MVHFEQGIDMSLGGGQTETPVAGSNKYAQIMELMRKRNAMNPLSYTGGFNPYGSATSVSAAPSSYYDELMREQALANPNSNRGGSSRGQIQESRFNSESPMAGSGPSTFMGNLTLGLDAYGNALGGFLPGGFLAQLASQFMNPYAAINESQTNQDRLAGLIAADPSYGGGGYGTSVSSGGYGVTSPTGAGIAANPMGNDVATAQGQQAAAAAANQAMTDAANAQATANAVAAGGLSYSSDSEGGLSPSSGGGGGGGDTAGRGEPGNRGEWGRGGGYAKGGQVTMDRLQGPNPMGPDDGYGGLDDGEYVINAKSVGKYGIELMNAINAGKISKGKLRGLLEA